MKAALRKLIEKEINPYVDEWEAAKAFPGHQVRAFTSTCSLDTFITVRTLNKIFNFSGPYQFCVY